MTASFLEDPFVAANPEQRPFWAAAEEGRLLGKRCQSCDRFHWYPRSICPFCHSADTYWSPLSGLGRVHAFSTLRRARPAYIVAYVQLDEGPMLLTNLIESAALRPEIGLRVQVVFRRTEQGRCAPKFIAAG